MVEQLTSLFLSLTSPTPLWFSACLLVGLVALFFRQRALLRRLEKHSESIGHMDAWADDVDAAIMDLQRRSRHMPSAYLPVRSRPADTERGWPR